MNCEPTLTPIRDGFHWFSECTSHRPTDSRTQPKKKKSIFPEVTLFSLNRSLGENPVCKSLLEILIKIWMPYKSFWQNLFCEVNTFQNKKKKLLSLQLAIPSGIINFSCKFVWGPRGKPWAKSPPNLMQSRTQTDRSWRNLLTPLEWSNSDWWAFWKLIRHLCKGGETGAKASLIIWCACRGGGS